MMKRTVYNSTILLASVAATAMCVLPTMSAYSGGRESCTLNIRGFNLMEFSAWGCIPFFAPLLISAILFGHQSKAAQEAELMLLFGANMVGYVHSFNAARGWLAANSASLITYHPGMLLYPIAFVAVMMLGCTFRS